MYRMNVDTATQLAGLGDDDECFMTSRRDCLSLDETIEAQPLDRDCSKEFPARMVVLYDAAQNEFSEIPYQSPTPSAPIIRLEKVSIQCSAIPGSRVSSLACMRYLIFDPRKPKLVPQGRQVVFGGTGVEGPDAMGGLFRPGSTSERFPLTIRIGNARQEEVLG